MRKDPRRVAFKDVTEDMIPAAMEKMRPVSQCFFTYKMSSKSCLPQIV